MKKISYQGWNNCLQLSNGKIDLVITLDVGPRILRFGPVDGTNVFKEYPEQMGQSGESSWRIRGGHRLWLAPEADYCYLPDNQTVTHREISENHVIIESPAEEGPGWQKEIEILLDSDTNHVTIRHRIKALRSLAEPVALWALSVMAPGGTAILPQPSLGTHPEHLLPNRKLVLWPYTRIDDPRFTWGGPNITVKQEAEGVLPTKIGLLQQTGWAAYQLGSWIFAKTVPYQTGVKYPDNGVNFELFTNHEMLELETLGGLVKLEKDQIIEHIEKWTLIEALGFNPANHSLLSILPS